MSPEECVAIGGHCWVEADAVMVQAVMGGARFYRRRCKHCGKAQEGKSQAPVVWTDK